MITVFIVFLILLIIGVPVAFAIGASGMVFFLQNTHFPLTHVAQLPLTQVQSISMLAIPLFILAGNLMNNGGVTKRLVSLATLLTGHMRGGCSHGGASFGPGYDQERLFQRIFRQCADLHFIDHSHDPSGSRADHLRYNRKRFHWQAVLSRYLCGALYDDRPDGVCGSYCQNEGIQAHTPGTSHFKGDRH